MKFKPEGDPETPYQRARQEFDDYIGNARVQSKNWRLAFFCLLIILFLTIGGLIAVAMQVKIAPYIVEVGPAGAVNVVAKVGQNYDPSQAATKYFVSQFVSRIRSIPVDPVVLRNNFLTAYNYVTPTGKNTLNGYARDANPFNSLGKKAISVSINSVVKLSENSYQVNWIEEEYSIAGAPVQQKNYTGVFNLALITPKDEKQLINNPLGVYVDFFNISQVS